MESREASDRVLGAGARAATGAGGTRPTQGAETARRTLRLLEALADRPPHRLNDLADATGLSKSTTYRLLRVLQEESYVEHLSGGGYRLGPAFSALSTLGTPQAHIQAIARPALQKLVDGTGETATLHRRAGDLAVLVFGLESERHTLRQAARIGDTTPLTRGCAGQVILAHLDRGTADAIITRAAPSPPQRHALRVALDTVAEQGYALSENANHPGVRGIAAPLLSPDGVEHSIAISGPADRWTHQHALDIADTLTSSCAALTTHRQPGS